MLSTEQAESNWTDAENAVKTHDVPWLSQNLDVLTTQMSNLKFVAITTLQGHVITQSGNVAGFTTDVNYPGMMALATQKVVSVVGGGGFYGIVKTPQGLFMVAAAGIVDNNGTTKPVGILFMGKPISIATLAGIKNILHSDVAILMANQPVVSSSKQITASLISQYVAKVPSEGNGSSTHSSVNEWNGVLTAHSTSDLRDISGHSVGTFYLQMPVYTSSMVTDHFRRIGSLAVFIMLALFILALVIVDTRVIRPLRKFRDTLEMVASGSLAEQTAIKQYITRTDEVGIIGNSIRNLIQNMHGALENVSKRINETAEQMAAASEELTATSESAASAMTEINTSMREISQGADVQLHGANRGAVSVQNMIRVLDGVTEETIELTGASSSTVDDAEQGNSFIVAAVKQMDVIEHSVDDVAIVLKSLHERSSTISQIVSDIAQIATQTNLLALNASIEAARAGEEGRGFAVVAQEVRALAERSSTATTQIKKIVEQILTDTDRAVDGMSLGSGEIQKGAGSVRTAGKVFERIVGSSRAMATRIERVSKASQQLLESSQEFAHTTEEMTHIAQVAAGNSKNAARDSEEHVVTMKGIVSSANHLSQMAQDLLSVLEYFKL